MPLCCLIEGFLDVLIKYLRFWGSTVQTNEDYFLHNTVLQNRKFAYHALREDTLTDSEKEEYECTYLKNCVKLELIS